MTTVSNPQRCTPEHLKRLAAPFFSQGEARVFFSRCCGWVYVGARPADICKRCEQKPTNIECSSVDQVQALADP